jgi:hypothetical protein
MCGVEFSGNDGHPGPRECCQRANDPILDCDNKYFGMGPAFEDMLDFMRDESLWLRKYADSWWAATENNFGNLSSLDATTGDVRQTLSDDMNQNCLFPAGQCDNLTADSPCFLVTAGIVSNSQREQMDYVCMNKHRPISEQRPNRVSGVEWQYASIVSLENAQASSFRSEFTAERALHPQWRIETGDSQYSYHANFDNSPWNSSCSITAAESPAWWSADFVGGASAVQQVDVYSLNGYTSWLDGATVYIDDVDCGNLDVRNTRPSQNDSQMIEFRNTSRDCQNGGSSIRIETTHGSGLAICGIAVYSGDQFPL